MHLVTDPAGLSAAAWITHSETPFEQLVSFGPAGFEASARLRFIPDPTGPGQDEGDADLPDDHPHDLVQTQLALHRLEAYTSTPGDCYLGLWEGYPYVGLPELPQDSWRTSHSRTCIRPAGPPPPYAPGQQAFARQTRRVRW